MNISDSNNNRWSISPTGIAYPIPNDQELDDSVRLLTDEAVRQRSLGRHPVVVQGIGAVGTAVAAVLSEASTSQGAPAFFVVAVDLPTPSSYWKVPQLNSGVAPLASADPELDALLARGVHEIGNLCASASPNVYGIAETIVMDIGVDVASREISSASEIEVRFDPLRSAARAVGRTMSPTALVLVETTLPPGTCETEVRTILTEERARRGITQPLRLAYAYERVTPGPNYVASIKRTGRGYAGVDEESADAAARFLEQFLTASVAPLHRFETIASAELAKLLENSYRAVNIAFIHEWTLLAEAMQLDLFDIVESIRIRTGTHDNIRNPGLGVGGYCLPKDPLFAEWAGNRLPGHGVSLPVTSQAVQINRLMPQHTVDLVVEAAGGDLHGRTIAVLGASYAAGIGDSRDSPSLPLVQGLLDHGATVVAHDPYLADWPEMPHVQLVGDIESAIAGADGVVFAVPHKQYDANVIQGLTSHPSSLFIVDAQNIVSDEQAQILHDTGHRLIGVGKGHWLRKGFNQ